MELIKIFIDVLLPIFGVIAFAAFTDRYLHLDTKLLARLNIYLLCPLLILISLENIELQGKELWMIVIMAVGSAVVMAIIGTLLSSVLRLDRWLSGAFILCVFMGNTGGMGFSLAQFAFGDEGLQRAVLFFAVVGIVNSPLAIFISSRGSYTIKESLMNIVKNPIIYATITGLLLNTFDLHLPTPLERFAEIPARASIPFTLILLGVQLARIKVVKNLNYALVASVARLIVAPLVGFGIAALVGVSGLAMKSTIIQIAMPAATFTAVFATEYGSDAEFASMVGLITTLGSIITLSLLLLLL